MQELYIAHLQPQLHYFRETMKELGRLIVVGAIPLSKKSQGCLETTAEEFQLSINNFNGIFLRVRAFLFY